MPATACRTTVLSIENLSFNVRSFRLKLEEPSSLAFQAGQFLILNVPKDKTTVKRAYSIASPPHETGILELCVQRVEEGIASTYLWQLKEGEKVSLSGPHGTFVLKDSMDYDPIFVATGTGIAPLRGMIKHLFHINFTRDVWLLFGCRYEHAILYDSEFRSLASLRRNFHYIPTVSRPKEWRGEVGYVQKLFTKHTPYQENQEIYLCGFSTILKAILTDLSAAGVPKEKLHFEDWG